MADCAVEVKTSLKKCEKVVCTATFKKHKRSRARKLRRKRSRRKYLQYLNEVRVNKNSEELCTSVSLFDICDMEDVADPLFTYPLKEVAEWQYQHQLAYWKSRAIALEYENRMLHQHLRNAYAKQIDAYAQYVEEELEEEKEMEYEEKDEDESKKPPKEQVGERKREEMKRLYGEMSPKITGMETAMQLNYDLQLDKLNPPYWPNIPLNL